MAMGMDTWRRVINVNKSPRRSRQGRGHTLKDTGSYKRQENSPFGLFMEHSLFYTLIIAQRDSILIPDSWNLKQTSVL